MRSSSSAGSGSGPWRRSPPWRRPPAVPLRPFTQDSFRISGTGGDSETGGDRAAPDPVAGTPLPKPRRDRGNVPTSGSRRAGCTVLPTRSGFSPTPTGALRAVGLCPDPTPQASRVQACSRASATRKWSARPGLRRRVVPSSRSDRKHGPMRSARPGQRTLFAVSRITARVRGRVTRPTRIVGRLAQSVRALL
jgi:hypothetical protein